jgi:uncharacterized membrane-anchored protein
MFARAQVSLLLLATVFAFAENPPVPGKAPPTREQISAAYSARVFKVMDGALYREGRQELPGGMAHLRLPDGYRYLGPDDARKVIVDLWGNPPAAASNSLLGVIIPEGEHLASPSSWVIVLSYVEEGHVSDSDAGQIDFDGLMTRLQTAGAESNKARRASGFVTMDLAGWAVAPRYDADARALFWAKRFTVTHQPEDTLNYDVRVLGRHGVLSLNAIASMNRVADIEAASPAIISMVRFNEGKRYGDFDPTTDREAGLTLAGLLLGGAPPVESPPLEQASAPKLWIYLVPLGLILLLLFKSRRTPALSPATPAPPETIA